MSLFKNSTPKINKLKPFGILTFLYYLGLSSIMVIGLVAFALISKQNGVAFAADPISQRWSDPSTWPNNQVPTNGQQVTIPAGQKVLLDTNSASLGNLRVDGILEFEDKSGVSLTSNWILVGGEFRVGTEQNPFQNKTKITLTGKGDTAGRALNVEGSGAMTVGNKFLATKEGFGKIKIHGARRSALSWTQLNQNANAGDTEITLKENVDGGKWRVGDRLVISPSGYDPRQAEEIQITEINGNKVKFSSPLRYNHWGTLQTIEGVQVDQRSTVGLLTRDVIIESSDQDSGRNDNGFGGHVMIRGVGAEGKLEGIQLNFMGQRRMAGRYPIHWHHTGDVTGQYAKNNSVYKSFHRGYVIHGTSNVTITDNVAFDVFSHTFVPAEDGNEINNRFERNLAVLTKTLSPADFVFNNGQGTSQTERRPASFWLRNANNILEGNVAAGSIDGSGFFYDFVGSPASAREAQRNSPMGVFRNNTAHSNFITTGPNGRQLQWYHQARNSFGLFLTDVPNGGLHKFENLNAYKNSLGAVWAENGNLEFTGNTFSDNLFGFNLRTGLIKDSNLVGYTNNRENSEVEGLGYTSGRTVKPGGVLIPYVWQNIGTNLAKPEVRNVKFVNYPNAAITYEDPKINDQVTTSGITLVNTKSVDFNYEAIGGIADLDGSLSGRNQPTAIIAKNSSAHLINNQCAENAELDLFYCPLQNYYRVEVEYDNSMPNPRIFSVNNKTSNSFGYLTPKSGEIAEVSISRFGPAGAGVEPTPLNRFPNVGNDSLAGIRHAQGFLLKNNESVLIPEFQYSNSEQKFKFKGDTANSILGVKYFQAPGNIRAGGGSVPARSSKADLQNNQRGYFYDSNEKVLYLKPAIANQEVEFVISRGNLSQASVVNGFIDYPKNDQITYVGQRVDFILGAMDSSNKNINGVEFLVNGSKVGDAQRSNNLSGENQKNWVYNWTPQTAGDYRISIKVNNNSGQSFTTQEQTYKVTSNLNESQCSLNNVQVSVFNNNNLSGNPASITCKPRSDDSIHNFFLGGGQKLPGITIDNYSMRVKTNRTLDRGNYALASRMSPSSWKTLLDGQLVQNLAPNSDGRYKLSTFEVNQKRNSQIVLEYVNNSFYTDFNFNLINGPEKMSDIPEINITSLWQEGGKYYGYTNQPNVIRSGDVYLHFNNQSPTSGKKIGVQRHYINNGFGDVDPFEIDISAKPANATQLCVKIADKNYSSDFVNSGNCIALPNENFTTPINNGGGNSSSSSSSTTTRSMNIGSITLNNNNQYVVNFTTSGFTNIPGNYHTHFYYNTEADSIQNKMYSGASPYLLDISTKPANATQLCSIVGNPNHSVDGNTGSGNCVNLPSSSSSSTSSVTTSSSVSSTSSSSNVSTSASSTQSSVTTASLSSCNANNQWFAEYFTVDNNDYDDNRDFFYRSRNHARCETEINHDWPSTGTHNIPNTPQDWFSGRWTRTVNFPQGTYRFKLVADDIGKLFINNQEVLRVRWEDGGNGKETTLTLNGSTSLRLETKDGIGTARAKLSWVNATSSSSVSNNNSSSSSTNTSTSTSTSNPQNPTLPASSVFIKGKNYNWNNTTGNLDENANIDNYTTITCGQTPIGSNLSIRDYEALCNQVLQAANGKSAFLYFYRYKLNCGNLRSTTANRPGSDATIKGFANYAESQCNQRSLTNSQSVVFYYMYATYQNNSNQFIPWYVPKAADNVQPLGWIVWGE